MGFTPTGKLRGLLGNWGREEKGLPPSVSITQTPRWQSGRGLGMDEGDRSLLEGQASEEAHSQVARKEPSVPTSGPFPLEFCPHGFLAASPGPLGS